TTPRVLVGQIRGDLDWITLKALEKERTRRYKEHNHRERTAHGRLVRRRCPEDNGYPERRQLGGEGRARLGAEDRAGEVKAPGSRYSSAWWEAQTGRGWL